MIDFLEDSDFLSDPASLGVAKLCGLTHSHSEVFLLQPVLEVSGGKPNASSSDCGPQS